MAKEIPFDEDMMTLIMGVGGPEEPGQHGRTQKPMPEMSEIDLITQIRDLCEEFLSKVDKEKGESEKPSKESEETPEETEEEE